MNLLCGAATIACDNSEIILKANEYFKGRTSIGFENDKGRATAGVMAVGAYEFGTSKKRADEDRLGRHAGQAARWWIVPIVHFSIDTVTDQRVLVVDEEGVEVGGGFRGSF